ncbi:MAG: hypothetical protein J6C59_09320 [Muribaculaceae bacterium]|nr:hypothetical protein [Muribaculaceae bacterium]
MRIFGTHNTMSYLPPKRWWMRPLRVFARCQRKTLTEQIAAGAQVFDLRVYREGDYWCFAHGLVKFKGATLYTTLDVIPSGSVVRVILERGHGEDVVLFRKLCVWLDGHFHNLTFIGARRKRGWQLIHDFAANRDYPDYMIHQHVGSMASDARWYERFVPILYARRRCVDFDDFANGVHLYDFL